MYTYRLQEVRMPRNNPIHVIETSYPTVWAATTRENDFLRMEGYKRVIAGEVHRKEVIAGNLAEYLTDRAFSHLQLCSKLTGL